MNILRDKPLAGIVYTVYVQQHVLYTKLIDFNWQQKRREFRFITLRRRKWPRENDFFSSESSVRHRVSIRRCVSVANGLADVESRGTRT